jgi:hypothetical protein
MMQSINNRLSTPSTALEPVTTSAAIMELVKESEVLTGKPGRKFLICGAERLAYRVQWQVLAFKVERLDQDGQVLDAAYLLDGNFAGHSLGSAIAAGILLTPALAT